MRAAEKRLGFAAVCLIGYPGRVPRHFGDNLGAWPVRVCVTRSPRDVAKKPDIESPLHKVAVLEFVWCQSDAHAKRLKAALDEQLLGRGAENVKLRHGWRDIEDPEVVWPILLGDAIQGLEMRQRRSSVPAFNVFGEDERMRRVEAEARNHIRRWG